MASTGIEEGQNNPGFVASLDDEVNTQRPSGDVKEAFQDEDEDSRCRVFGLIPLPSSFQRLFVSASWILVFLSLASTIQVVCNSIDMLMLS